MSSWDSPVRDPRLQPYHLDSTHPILLVVTASQHCDSPQAQAHIDFDLLIADLCFLCLPCSMVLHCYTLHDSGHVSHGTMYDIEGRPVAPLASVPIYLECVDRGLQLCERRPGCQLSRDGGCPAGACRLSHPESPAATHPLSEAHTRRWTLLTGNASRCDVSSICSKHLDVKVVDWHRDNLHAVILQ